MTLRGGVRPHAWCCHMSTMVSPRPQSCVRCTLQPGAAGRHPPPRGLLFVNVVEAVNIPNLDWRSLLSKPDTFVECALQLPAHPASTTS